MLQEKHFGDMFFVFLRGRCFNVKHIISYTSVINNCKPDRYIVSELLILGAILYLCITYGSAFTHCCFYSLLAKH